MAELDGYEAPPDHTITIPASPWLSANQRQHWTVRADLTAAWRQAAGWAAKASGTPALGLSRVVAELHMVPRRRVRIDPANYAPTAKACVDGLVDAGIWPDDSSGWVVGPDMRLGPPVKTAADEVLRLLIWGRSCCEAAGRHHQHEEAPRG
jgi:hypothetical protein